MLLFTARSARAVGGRDKKEKIRMDKLLEILKGLHPEVDFETCENLVDGKILDSFDIISIISEISEEFDVTVSAEYIVPENFNSAKALYALIEKLEDED